MPSRRNDPSFDFGLLRGLRPRANRLILIADADLAFTQSLWQQGLERDPPIEIGSAHSAFALIDRLNALTPKALAINLELPGCSVTQLIATIARHPLGRHMPIIGLSDSASESLLVACREAGASHILQKPCNLEVIVKACCAAVGLKPVDSAPGP